MKEEDKIITIFSKNGITIKKKIDRSKAITFPCAVYAKSSTPSGIVKPTYYNQKKKDVIIKRESPLGFYYDYKTAVFADNKTEYNNVDYSKTIVNITIFNLEPNYTYEISYLLSYHGTIVDKETRPWDLLGGDFPDNYMFGLLNDINKIFNEFATLKNSKTYIDPKRKWSFNGYVPDYDESSTTSIGEFRRKIINDLFGDPDGPKFQTNDEKILAHGFDLKTSFRKM